MPIFSTFRCSSTVSVRKKNTFLWQKNTRKDAKKNTNFAHNITRRVCWFWQIYFIEMLSVTLFLNLTKTNCWPQKKHQFFSKTWKIKNTSTLRKKIRQKTTKKIETQTVLRKRWFCFSFILILLWNSPNKDAFLSQTPFFLFFGRNLHWRFLK